VNQLEMPLHRALIGATAREDGCHDARPVPLPDTGVPDVGTAAPGSEPLISRANEPAKFPQLSLADFNHRYLSAIYFSFI